MESDTGERWNAIELEFRQRVCERVSVETCERACVRTGDEEYILVAVHFTYRPYYNRLIEIKSKPSQSMAKQ